MWIVLIGALMLLGVMRTARVNDSLAHSMLSTVQARWLARAGVEQAVAELAYDTGGIDGPGDGWYDSPLTFQNNELSDGYRFDVVAPPDDHMPPGTRRFGLVDAASRININTAEPEQLRALDLLTAPQIDAVIDWRDTNDRIQPGGAERGYYEQLKLPYDIRNGPLQTMRELLLVRDIDQAAYFGEDINENGMIDTNEDDGEASWPPDDADGRLTIGLAGLTTIYSYEWNRTVTGTERLEVNSAGENEFVTQLNFTQGLASAVVKKRANGEFKKLTELVGIKADQSQAAKDEDREKVSEITLEWLAGHLDELTLSDDERLPGRININTASRAVLMTLPQMTADAADTIVNYRVSAQGPFRSVGELLLSRTLDAKQFTAVAELVTVRSNVFTIESRGRTPWGISERITAIVDRRAQPIKVLYWHQSE
jgi:DNA uptake protein ComE-like DNA-binding protein